METKVKRFLHLSYYRNESNTIELLRSLRGMDGVQIVIYGYNIAPFTTGFSIIFDVDQEAEVFLELKYGRQKFRQITDMV